MTSEEIQRQLDVLEQKRNSINEARELQRVTSESVIASIRHTVFSMQKNVEDIMEPLHGKTH